MEKIIDKTCIVRSAQAGVFFGEVAEFDAATATATLRNVRKIWYWEGACAIEEIAKYGVKDTSKLTVVVDEMIVSGIGQIIPCTKEAEKCLSSIPVWAKNE